MKRVSVSTVDYFIRHPETWYARGRLRPRPARLLDDRPEEDYDVYENRFVLHFLVELDTRLRGLVQQTKSVADALRQRLPESVTLLNRGLSDESDQDLLRLRKQSEQAHQELQSLRRFHATVLRVQNAPIFGKVRPLAAATKANTVLRLHPIYGRLFQLYQEIRQTEFSHARMRWLEELERADLQSAYRDYCIFVVARALEECHFERIGQNAGRNAEASVTFRLREDRRA